MNLNLSDITFVIVTYKSESIIQDCLNTLPKDSKKIIVENSNNINFEKDLKLKYDNIEVILSENNGMGAGNNIGLKSCKTKFAYILNPDTKLNQDTIKNLIKGLNQISDFTIASPLNDDPNYPNYKKNNSYNKDQNILSVDRIDGFSMLINLEKFSDNNFFDENFFLYLENDDLCIRVKKKNGNIYIVQNSLINHTGGISKKQDLEYLRNWHWMWSKFYFNKKNYGIFFAYLKSLPNLFSSMIKFTYYALSLNKHKKYIYYMRLTGIINGMLGKNSWLRPDE
tara:strand:+ start:621 stop:1466 length:846 start_codon:yes stop_codon:yes gene_type:complete